jgi:hypothetical protein
MLFRDIFSVGFEVTKIFPKSPNTLLQPHGIPDVQLVYQKAKLVT